MPRVSAVSGMHNGSAAQARLGMIAAVIGMLLMIAADILCFGPLLKGAAGPVEPVREEQEELEPEPEQVKEEEPPVFDVPETAPEVDYRRLVCVPTNALPIREEPGGKGDALTELPPGTMLRWYGEEVAAGGNLFYHVETEDGAFEGYVTERYVIPVETPADEALLDIVDATDALYTYEEMEEDIAELLVRYPDRIADEVIGESLDGRQLHALTIGEPEAPQHIMMQAAIHGREYMASQLAMKLAEYYCTYYDAGTYRGIPYRELFAHTAIHLIPMANPDGVTISQYGAEGLRDPEYREAVLGAYERERLKFTLEEDVDEHTGWVDHYRIKGYDASLTGDGPFITQGEYTAIWKADARGVDLNRNFDAGWEEVELKEEPAHSSYKGEVPCSEPEVRALTEYSERYDHLCYVNYHARGNIIYYDAVGSTEEVSAASEDLAKRLQAVTKYDIVNTTEVNNVNPGGFGDWAQRILGKPGVTIEVGRYPCPLEIGEFPGMWGRNRETWAMLLADAIS